PCVSARLRPRPAATLFPYTTLFRSVQASGAGERRALLGEPDHRVDGLIVDVDLEVQVCAGGEPEVSHAGDRLPGHHTVTHGHVDGLHVAVDGHGAVVCQDPDPIAEALGGARVHHLAVGGRHDGRAVRVGDVDAVVHAAPARPEAGGERALRGQDHLGASCLLLGDLALGVDLGARVEHGR